MADRIPEVGNFVIWVDAVGNDCNALVTVVWNPNLVNLVIISNDESKQDSYGRQIERPTSCSHMSPSSAHGFYWRWPDEQKMTYKAPDQK